MSIDYCGDLGFLPKLNLYPKFNLGDTVKVEDAAWELGIRDTFSLTNKQCFVMGFVRSGSIYLNFVNPNIHENKKLFPKFFDRLRTKKLINSESNTPSKLNYLNF